MNRLTITTVILVSLSGVLLADSIDDAEAKRRGVPVGQVQVENVLAKERAKTAALEKQIAALQKQLADMRNSSDSPQAPSTPSASNLTNKSTPASPPSGLSESRPQTEDGSPTMALGPTADLSKVLLAGDLLAKFPGNVPKNLLNNQVTIQGRIAEVQKLSENSTKAVFRLMVVGEKQSDVEPAHFSCLVDATGSRNFLPNHAGEVIQITGVVTTIFPDAARIDLTQCLAPKLLPGPEWKIGSAIIGEWRGSMTSDRPLNTLFKFSPDNTLTAVFADSTGGQAILKGTWKTPDDAAKSKSLIISLEKTDGPVEIEFRHDTYNPDFLLVPSIPPLFFMIGDLHLSLERVFGTVQTLDPGVMETQMTQWLRAHVDAPQLQAALAQANKTMASARTAHSDYEFRLGAGMTTSHKATDVTIMNGKLFAFEYTDAQTGKSGLKPTEFRASEIRKNFAAEVPEVNIELVTLETANQMDPTKELKGTIKWRGLQVAPKATYALVVETAQGTMTTPLKGSPSLDSYALEFNFPAFKAGFPQISSQNPLSIFFSVIRISQNGPPVRVSDSVGQLMDITP